MPVKNENERLSVISDCCDQAFEMLNSIRDKVLQIIDYKKNNPKAGGDELIRRQVNDYLVALENLSCINQNLEGAIIEVQQLCNQAHLMLGKELEVSEGFSLGMQGSSVIKQEESESDDRG